MEDIQKILKLVITTGYIKDVNPLSLLIVGESGTGKTEVITHFKTKTLVFFTDVTYIGLLEKLKEQKDIKHIIIPDFIKITQKKRATSDNFISILNALTEEGIGEINLYRTHYDLRDKKGNNKRAGLITATTKESFNQHKKHWNSFGFVQRMLIISYSYSEETTNAIIEHINREEYLKYKKENMIGIGKSIKSEEKLNAQLNKISNKKFRSLKVLQTLAKANALLNKRNNVTQEDINEIIRLSKFMNLNYTKI